MGQERSAWSVKGGRTTPLPPITPEEQGLKKALQECLPALRGWEKEVLQVVINRVTLFPVEDQLGESSYVFSVAANSRRDASECVGWAEWPEAVEERRALRRAGVLIQEYMRLVLLKKGWP